ncbi:hypothetical protein CGCF245_v005845 [Colletotrichum fructicola]|nr:hypothetical protein CGCF245_v005845 [Colletotrichum fructicola]
MQIQNVVLAIATLCLGDPPSAQAAFDCKCKDDAKTTSCCNAQKFISAKRNDGKLMCYVNNVVAPLPASFPFKTCCGDGGFDFSDSDNEDKDEDEDDYNDDNNRSDDDDDDDDKVDGSRVIRV